tara:strand:- start:4499 stop:5437 length:939 start_codon:yes stop_codon:yes gene_type:complete
VFVLTNKIGLIGYGNQAKRLEKYLNQIGYKISIIYKPNFKKNLNKFTNDFKKIQNCEIIFICSTNSTHFLYLKKLIGKKYIFCEKPPVSSYDQLLKLKKIINNKVFFNYNLRFCEISNLIQEAKKHNFGNLLFANIILTHGLSSKKGYLSNWRSKKKLSPKGVFETVSIHALDIILYNFGIKKILSEKLTNTSGRGTAYDTSFLNIITKNNANISIFCSYNSPLVNSWIFVFENGTLKYDNNILKLNGPRNNFDKNNNFIEPKNISSKRISYKKLYEKSLFNSVNHFMKTVKNKKKFQNELSLISNKLILQK